MYLAFANHGLSWNKEKLLIHKIPKLNDLRVGCKALWKVVYPSRLQNTYFQAPTSSHCPKMVAYLNLLIIGQWRMRDNCLFLFSAAISWSTDGWWLRGRGDVKWAKCFCPVYCSIYIKMWWKKGETNKYGVVTSVKQVLRPPRKKSQQDVQMN